MFPRVGSVGHVSNVSNIQMKPQAPVSKIAFRGDEEEDIVDITEQENTEESLDNLKELAESEKAPKALRTLAKGGVIAAGGLGGYAAFKKGAPETVKYLKSYLDSAVSEKNQKVIVDGVKSIGKKVVDLASSLDIKAYDALKDVKNKKGETPKFAKIMLDAREGTQETVAKTKKWVAEKGKNTALETSSILVGGTAAIEGNQELGQFFESVDKTEVEEDDDYDC